MDIKDIKEYELIEEREVSDLNSKGYVLKHKKSGARLMLLSNDDENKVFAIGFRTPPTDSTGVAHIIEHSVLCGSEKFPAKDPFIELAKGSLNTFLNAMTYPDKTVYPVASCNDKDFQNLMDVYMDAVLNPNIYKRQEIFKQEGWHYELESVDDDITISGVVYGEMKGAFSSPEGSLDREIFNSLFPDTAYGVESGGDPDDIPKLTYEAFLDFHRRYYHPVNSYIYLYGNMDMAEKLSWLDKEYLSKYERIEIDSEIGTQKPFDKMREITKEYSITNEESEEENTYLTYNKVVGTSLDKELYIAFQILEYALMSPGAPLRQALLDAGIGKDILSSYDGGIKQPMFSVIAKNSDPDKKEKFLKVIEDVLTEQVKNGINRKSLLAGINVFEFKYREADFGPYPKGLMFGLQSFDSWLYDENEPFMHLEANAVFAQLRKKIDGGYFEGLIKKYLLDNSHGSVLIYVPKKGLTEKKDKELEEKLRRFKKSLSKEELEAMVAETAALKKYQTEPSTKEELESIPLLKIEDIRKKVLPFANEELDVDGTKVVFHDYFTNGIGYLTLFFDMKDVSTELMPYVGLLKTLLGLVDTKNYSYQELTNEININSGGISPNMSIYSDVRDKDKYRAMFTYKARVLYDKVGTALDIISEIINTSVLDDYKRMKEVILEAKSRYQMYYNNAGHAVAMLRGMSYFSPVSRFSDMTTGLEQYDFLNDLEEHFEDKKEEITKNLRAVTKALFRPENLLVSFTSTKDGLEELKKNLPAFAKTLCTELVDNKKYDFKCEKKNEGFKTAAKVFYVSRTGNFKDAGFEYTGRLQVLKTILGYDYLWNNIRVLGGAYGCMSGFSRNGDSYLASYRDPNLEKTIEVFEGVPEYIEKFDVDDRDMTKYIIGTMSNIDTPLTPNNKGVRSMTAYLTNLTEEISQKERDAVLSTKQEDIRALAPMVRAVIDQDNLCVLGSEKQIEDSKKLFMNVKTLK